MAEQDVPPTRVGRDSSKMALIRLGVKTAFLLISLNLFFGLVDPITGLGRLSFYNTLFPGRMRLPYGDDPSLSYNMTINQLDAMFASHEIQKAQDAEKEYRVFLIGDSSVWGFLQRHNETIAARLNQRGLRTSDGRSVRFYNLGYPTLSLTKDLLILDYARAYQPDLILWFITLEALPTQKQLDSPLLTFNAEAVIDVLDRTNLAFDESDENLRPLTFWDKTIIGRRRVLADLIRHQIFGLLWTATGIDHHIPASYNQRAEDLSDDLTFQGMAPEQFQSASLAFNVMQAGMDLSEAPIVLVNEPIFISSGENSDIRYNFYYPIWAYDFYLSSLAEEADANGWDLINIWDLLPAGVFTDSAIHYNQDGVERVIHEILSSPQLSILGASKTLLVQ